MASPSKKARKKTRKGDLRALRNLKDGSKQPPAKAEELAIQDFNPDEISASILGHDTAGTRKKNIKPLNPGKRKSIHQGYPADSDEDEDEFLGMFRNFNSRANSKEPQASSASTNPPHVTAHDVGHPWVQNKLCARCCCTVDDGWGVVSCCGCSCVDTLDFKEHLWRKLLAPESVEAPTSPVLKPRASRDFCPLKVPLTPPSLGIDGGRPQLRSGS
jgi:hypothetical protein